MHKASKDGGARVPLAVVARGVAGKGERGRVRQSCTAMTRDDGRGRSCDGDRDREGWVVFVQRERSGSGSGMPPETSSFIKSPNTPRLANSMLEVGDLTGTTLSQGPLGILLGSC